MGMGQHQERDYNDATAKKGDKINTFYNNICRIDENTFSLFFFVNFMTNVSSQL